MTGNKISTASRSPFDRSISSFVTASVGFWLKRQLSPWVQTRRAFSIRHAARRAVTRGLRGAVSADYEDTAKKLSICHISFAVFHFPLKPRDTRSGGAKCL